MPGGTLAKAVPAVRLLCLPLRACPYFHVPCSPCIRCSPRIRMLPASCPPVSRLTARMERAAADWPAYSVALCLGAHLDAYHVSRELCLVLRLGAFRCESERPSASLEAHGHATPRHGDAAPAARTRKHGTETCVRSHADVKGTSRCIVSITAGERKSPMRYVQSNVLIRH